MAWEVKLARKCTSIVQWRVRFFCGYIRLRTGIGLVAIHTMIQGMLLFLPLFDHSEESQQSRRTLTLPDDCRLLSSLLASPLLVTGVTLFYAWVKPKTGLLYGYVVGTEAVLLLFPAISAAIYVRTFTEATKPIMTEEKDPEISRLLYYLYISLSYAVASYFCLFYNIVLVMSYKDERFRKLKESNGGENSNWRPTPREGIS